MTARPTRVRPLASLVLALLAGIAMLAVPLAPVTQQTASYRWDSADGAAALPLSPYRPERLRLTIDCARVGPDAGDVLTTVRGVDAGLRADALTLGVRGGAVTLTSNGERTAWLGAHPCQRLDLDLTTTGATLTRDGTPLQTFAHDYRPPIDGFSAPGARPATTGSLGQPGSVQPPAAVPPVPGITAEVTADTQWDSSPTGTKIALLAAAYALLAAAIALAASADRPRTRARWRLRPGWDDGLVAAAMAAGIVLGGPTDDDGFITQIMRTAQSGHLGNAMRWNNAPEAPFGWPYDLYALWARVSYEPVWLRLLPAVVAVVGWLVVRHGLLPRLVGRPGPAARLVLAAAYAGTWLVFGNSLRPEVWFATGLGVVAWCVLDALERRATTPLLVAALAAGLTVGTGPTGLVALAPLVVAAPALWRWLRGDRLRAASTAVVGLACLGAIVPVMFADQTLASVASATHARTTFGPAYGPLGEGLRYRGLWASYASRQFAAYASAVALALLAWAAWRGRWSAPRRRAATLVAASLPALVLVMLVSPTKVPHHVGAAALVGPLALAALTEAASWRRAPRGLGALTLGGTLVALGVALHAPNPWWKIARAGMVLDGEPLAIGPVPLWPLVVLAGLGVAVWGVVGGRGFDSLRSLDPREGEQRGFDSLRSLNPRERSSLNPRVLLALGLAVLVAAQLANAAQAAVRRGGGRYTMGAAAVAAATGHGCLLERSLYAETDPAAGALAPADGENPFTGPPEAGGLPSWAPPAGTTTTGWFALPAGHGAWPLVVATSALDRDHRVRVEFDRGLPADLSRASGRTLGASALVDRRVTPPADATRVRIVSTSSGPGLTVLQPRVPRPVPLTQLAAHRTIAAAWNLAFFAPCLPQPAQVDGRVAIPDLVLSDSLRPGNIAFDARTGGPFAGALGLAVPSRVPLYARGDRDPVMGTLDLVELVPAYGADLAPASRATRTRGGLDTLPRVP